MHWYLTHPTDQRGRVLADRHYSRQKPGAREFVPPGRKIVLVNAAPYQEVSAVWATSWPFAEYVNRDYKDAWICTIFRNESEMLSSQLIIEAIACTRWKYPTIPASGMITMVDARKVTSRNPGYCYKIVGFQKVGETSKGLHILQLKPEDMPDSISPHGVTWEANA